MMRFERTIAVLVLATGVICSRAAVADDLVTGKPGKKAPISLVPWKQRDLMSEHALLKGLVGHWTSKVHSYEGPYARARDTEGTAEGKLLMGGLFIQVTQTETRMKQPYERMTTYGFSEALGKYTADAIDTAATASIHYVGTYDAAKKQIRMSTHFTSEGMKSLTVARSVTTFVDENTWTYEEFVTRADRKEVPIVAIRFTRGKD